MKLISAVFPVHPGDPEENVREMIAVMDANPADLYLFPAFAVTGVTCGMLFAYRSFTEKSDKALDALCDYTATHTVTVVTSADGVGNLYLRGGQLGKKPTFEIEGKTVVISSDGQGEGDLILLPTAMAGYPCLSGDVTELCQKITAAKPCTVAVANPGYGEAVSDGVYQGFCGIYKGGKTLDHALMSKPETVLCRWDDSSDSFGWEVTRRPEADLRIPYFGKNDPVKYLGELFSLQVQALYTRLKAFGAAGLSLTLTASPASALALAVCAEAAKAAGMTPDKIFVSGTDRPECAALAEAFGVSDAKPVPGTLSVGSYSLTDGVLRTERNAGDYNINATVPDTVIVALLRLLAKRYPGNVGQALTDASDRAETTPADLQDFMLYYFSKHKLGRKDLYQYMMATFDEYDEETIVKALDDFFIAFARARFLRPCGESANLIGFTPAYIPAECNL